MKDDHPIRTPAELGAFIRAVRIASNLTQAEAAALCGVGGPFLSDLEGGKRTSQIGPTLAVCQGLGIEIHLTAPLPLDGAEKRKRRTRRPRVR